MRTILGHQRGEAAPRQREEAMNRARQRWRQSIAAHPSEAITPESGDMGFQREHGDK